MKTLSLLQIFLYLSLTLLSLASANKLKNRRIAIIRHGEKPEDDALPYLSEEGKARAQCLTSAIIKYDLVPQKIYAQQANEIRTSTRPIDTITPAAQSFGLDIDTSFREGNIKGLVKDIKNLDKDIDTIFISWSKDKIPKLAKKLGVDLDKDYEWDKEIFNQIWIIENGHLDIVDQNTDECIQSLLASQ